MGPPLLELMCVCVTQRVRLGLGMDCVLGSAHTARPQARAWTTVKVREEVAETLALAVRH